jgi:hypothetical protein
VLTLSSQRLECLIVYYFCESLCNLIPTATGFQKLYVLLGMSWLKFQITSVNAASCIDRYTILSNESLDVHNISKTVFVRKRREENVRRSGKRRKKTRIVGWS